MSSLYSHIIQVTNVAPAATLDQMKELFGFLGKIRDIRLYPTENYLIEPQRESKICYVQYAETWSVGVAQHLTNTVFVDRALIVVPIREDDGIPSEATALALTNPTSALPGLVSSSGQNNLINEITGVDGNLVITTVDPKLTALGLPQYPPLPANMEPSKIEEIRRTVYIGNLDTSVTAERLLKFVNNIGEVKFLRMAGMATENNEPVRYAYIEFTDQTSVSKVLTYNGVLFENRPLKISHSTSAIVKPQPKSTETAQKEIDEALKRVKEAQSLITAAIEPELGDKDKKRNRRSRSRSRSRRRSTSHLRRKRSRSRSKGPRSRKRSRSRIRSRSRRRSPRSPSKRSKREASRSRSRDKRKSTVSPRHRKKKSRSRSRDRTKKRRHTRSRSRSKSASKLKSRKTSSTKDSSKSEKSKNKDKSPHKEKTPRKESNEVKPKTHSDEKSKDVDNVSTEEYGPPVLTPEVPLSSVPTTKDTIAKESNPVQTIETVEPSRIPTTNEVTSNISIVKSCADTNNDPMASDSFNNNSIVTSMNEKSKSPGADKPSSPHLVNRSDSPNKGVSPGKPPTKTRSRSQSKGRSRSGSKHNSRSISKRRSSSRKRSGSKPSQRKSTRSPSVRHRRSRSPARRRSSVANRSPRHRSGSRRKSPIRNTRTRRSPTPKRRSRTPKRRSPSSKHHSRSPSYRKRSRSPGKARSRKSPPFRRSRSPRKRSTSLSPNDPRSKKKKDKREESLEKDKKKTKGEPETKDSKVVRNYDEEEKGYDSNADREMRAKEMDQVVEPFPKNDDSNNSFYNSGDMDLDSD